MTGQPKRILNTEPCGAIVKYNPCTKYARGSSCLYFDRWKKCDIPPLACQMPEYDKWYKDVLKEKGKFFYPNRIRLLEIPGVPMFLFHGHHHAIVGEAKIVRSTVEDEKHLYWFDEFVSYSSPVQLESLKTDPRLPKLAKGGQWRSVYISKDTIKEIRSLSKLSKGERKKLGNDLEKVSERVKNLFPQRFYAPTPRLRAKLYVKNECEKLKRHHKFDEQILAEARNYFLESVRKKLSIGRSHDEMFYASLYLAFRMLKIPTLLKDITEISGVSSRKLGKMYRLFARELNLVVPPLYPEELIKSRSGGLNISKNTVERAISLVREARKRRIILGNAPKSIAAIATFVACQKEGEKRKKTEIAQTFGVSKATIQNNYKKIEAL